jgi:hypothetical protein
MRMGLKGLGFAGLVCLVWAAAATATPTCMGFLKIVTAPAIAAMGEATVAVSDATWADINPAHLTAIDGGLVTFSHTSWYQDIALETLAVGSTAGKHAFGLTVVGLHTEPLDKYNVDDEYEGTFRFFNLLVGATYARLIEPSLSVGVTGKTLYEKIDWQSATGYAVDLGMSYSPVTSFLGGKVAAGLAMRNLGPKMGYSDEDFDLPLTWQGGLSYRPAWLPDYVGATASLDYVKVRDLDGGLLTGLEVGLAHRLALRLGYRGPYDDGNLTLGLGLGIGRTQVDYAYMDLDDDLGATHRVSVSLRLGPIFPSPESSR